MFRQTSETGRRRHSASGAAAVLVAVALVAATGCGGSSKPGYCTDRSDLESPVKGLSSAASSAVSSRDLSGLKSQVTKIQTDATSLVNSAKSDFPSETDAMKSVGLRAADRGRGAPVESVRHADRRGRHQRVERGELREELLRREQVEMQLRPRALAELRVAHGDVPAGPRVRRIARGPRASDAVVELGELREARGPALGARRVGDARHVELVGLVGAPRQAGRARPPRPEHGAQARAAATDSSASSRRWAWPW